MITFEQINKDYIIAGKAIPALRDINLTVNPAEIYGILGKSGAGKSTLLRCVNLLEKPSSGKIMVNNIELTELSASQLRVQRQKIGMIFQHFNLLESRTAFDNIALPLELLGQPRLEIQCRVKFLLDLVGLSDRQQYYPAQLSGGQKQRVAIARALAAKPHVLLCDEATSALDPNSTKSILQLLKNINQELGLTILLITHQLSVVKKICTQVGILDKGKLVENASVVEIFTNPQTELTRHLIQHDMHVELPKQIKADLQHPAPAAAEHTELVLLKFVGKDSERPILSALIKKFDLAVNILQANIENIQETIIGFTLCQLSGDKTKIADALQYLQTMAIDAEVVNHAK